MGIEVIDEFIANMHRYENDVQNFQSLWWEKIMMTWAANIAIIEKNIATNYFNSGFAAMKDGMWVESPFNFEFLKSYGSVFLLVFLTIPFFYKREI